MKKATRKLLVCGAFSSGKTTLVTTVADRLRGSGRSVAICDDVARSCPLPLNRDQTISTTIWLASEQVRRELEAMHEEPDYVLCDRGLPDILSHQALVPNGREDDLTLRFLAFARAWTRSYDAVFRCRVDHARPIVADGVRIVNDAFRRELDQSLLEELDCAGIKFETLSGNLDADVTFVMRRCDGLQLLLRDDAAPLGIEGGEPRRSLSATRGGP